MNFSYTSFHLLVLLMKLSHEEEKKNHKAKHALRSNWLLKANNRDQPRPMFSTDRLADHPHTSAELPQTLRCGPKQKYSQSYG